MRKDRPLKDVIKSIINNLEKREKEENDLSRIWEKTVGEKAARHTKIAFFKAKRLVVNVSDSSWLYKLTIDKKNLMKNLNKNIKGRKKIKELQFRIGEI